MQKVQMRKKVEMKSEDGKQGDQIGLIFVYCTIVFFGYFLKMTERA
jgi:hypothetical protein